MFPGTANQKDEFGINSKPDEFLTNFMNKIPPKK